MHQSERVTSGPRVKLASGKSALNPPVVYSTDRSKVVVLVLFLLFVALSFFFLYALWSPSAIAAHLLSARAPAPPVKYFSLTVPRRFFSHGLFLV